MMSMTSIETKHIVNKGFHNLKNPFFVNLSQKNAYSMKGKINHTSVAFYIAPYVNAICRSGSIEQKTLVFESMLKYKAFQIIPSTKRGHSLGETEQLVEQAVRIATNVKARQTKAQQAGLQKLQNMIIEQHLLDHKVLLFLLQPDEIDRNIAGLIANKFMAKYQRPVCILIKTINETWVESSEGLATLDGTQPPFEPPYKILVTSYQGSARGCEKVGITDFKAVCAGTGVTQYQIGHPNAFGLGILEHNIQTFIEKTDAALANISDEAIYYIDYIYYNNNVSSQDILDIANLQDLWGKDVEQPLVLIKGFTITSNMVTVYQKKDNTLKITLPNGISLIKFKATNEECEKLQNLGFGSYELNVIGTCMKNEWMGNISAQIFIEQYQIVDSNKWIF